MRLPARSTVRSTVRGGALALLAWTAAAACAGRGASSSRYVGARTWANCIGERVIEVRNDERFEVDIYTSGVSTPQNFLRAVGARSVTRIAAPGVSGAVYARIGHGDARAGTGSRARNVAIRYLCE